ncbi:MAG: tyrosine--tRNA ligase [Simkaniaceae bacterium]
MKNVIDVLKIRDFIDTLSSEDIHTHLQTPQKIYVGFDLTAGSLHLGNLIGINLLKWFQMYGHTPVVLLGGATTRIGDPSGKDKERPLISEDEIEKNRTCIKEQFSRFLDFSSENKAIILDNEEWLSEYSIIDFLQKIGKHFRLGPMLSKESVKLRLHSEEGMSFTEFCYQLLQGYDFYHLSRSHGVSIQGGGSDQWGNITAGLEFSRKMKASNLFGLTFPLLTRSDGKKFGKSEKGAIWLDRKLTSPYELYQYLLSIPDVDLRRLFQMLTFLNHEEIETILGEGENQPGFAQRKLAENLTQAIHGDGGLAEAEAATKAAAFGSDAVLNGEALRQAMKHLPNCSLKQTDVVGKRFTELAQQVGLTASIGEATRLIKNGGAYINNEKVINPLKEIEPKDLIDHCFLLLGSGKKKKILIAIKHD